MCKISRFMFYLLQKNPLIPIRHFCFEVQLKTIRLIHPLLFDLKKSISSVWTCHLFIDGNCIWLHFKYTHDFDIFTSYCDFGKQLLFETIKILASFQKCITMYMYFEGENGITIQYVQIYYPGSLTLDNSIN